MKKTRIHKNRFGFGNLVPRVGLEPTHLAAGDFESPASTNFATWAVSGKWNYTNIADIVKHFVVENVLYIVFKLKNISIGRWLNEISNKYRENLCFPINTHSIITAKFFNPNEK